MDAPGHRPSVAQRKASCSICGLRELCFPIGLFPDELRRVDQLVYARHKLIRGEYLYQAGNAFSAIYPICSGFFKHDLVHQDGRVQVIGFHMPGEILGIDGISADSYACNAVALEDSEVCVITFSRLEALFREVRGLQHQFHQVMSRAMVRDHGVMALLGSARADVRVAAFLIDLCRRFEARGHSASELDLPMTREEIGSFLGLTLETISRLLSKFQEETLIGVQQRRIRILDAAGLRRIAGSTG